MYARILTYPDHSFFLFGPRGTGKTTRLRHQFPDAHWFNLLLNRDLLPLLGDIGLFRKMVENIPGNSWIIVDEVQKLPELLNEIHDIISVYGD